MKASTAAPNTPRYLPAYAPSIAQEMSLELHRAAGAGAGDVLEIIFEKGGASVLADAWLAAGTLAPIAAEFAFAWGVALAAG